jgi:hypothetical protein
MWTEMLKEDKYKKKQMVRCLIEGMSKKEPMNDTYFDIWIM